MVAVAVGTLCFGPKVASKLIRSTLDEYRAASQVVDSGKERDMSGRRAPATSQPASRPQRPPRMPAALRVLAAVAGRRLLSARKWGTSRP